MNTHFNYLIRENLIEPATQVDKINILLIDDIPENLDLLSKILLRKGFNVNCAINGNLGLQIAQSGGADLILLDIQMPVIDGYQVCQQLKSEQLTKDIPIIFLSALDSIENKQKAFKSGGVDYISKPFQQQELLMRIENQIAILKAKSQLSLLNQELEARVKQRTEQLEKANQKLTQEIKQRQITQEKLLHLAVRDSLTGLPNRIWFSQRLKQLIELNFKASKNYFAVLFIDCDRFKLINDSLGHFIGDKVLIEVANRLHNCLEYADSVARFGGDEFAILLESVNSSSEVIKIAEIIQHKFTLPFKIQQHKLFLGASMGIVLDPNYYQEPEHLLRDADTAMYCAKSQGKSCYRVFNIQMHQKVIKKLNLENDLRLAIQEQQFSLCYQPIINLKTEKLAGFEALVRWHHPEQGTISPLDFIPLAEETGLIVPLGLWIMKTACQQLYDWQQQYNLLNIKIGINLSVKQFVQADLIQQIDRILEETKLKSHYLSLEITESAIMDNPQSVSTILNQLRQRKIKLSIDDFGTGYSSLSYLHQFPIDTLKIDRSFVQRINEKGTNLEIIKAIVTLAHNLRMNLVAEGIENSIQKQYLQQLGCEYGQGYYFAKPLSQETASLMLESLVRDLE